MTYPVFPVIRGIAWNVHKKPTWSTNVSVATSGRETRVANWAHPTWNFELTVEALTADDTSYPNAGKSTYQALMSLYMQCAGQSLPFLFQDNTDYNIVTGPIGTGDGTTTQFQFVRYMGSFVEPLSWIDTLTQVKLNNIVQSPSSVGLVAPNILKFNSPPASGAIISASFTFSFLCRFSEDTLDFSNISYNLWQVQSLKFQSVKDVVA